jgi:hypothetical protein
MTHTIAQPMICGPRGHLSRRSLLQTAGGVAFFGTLAGQLAAAAESQSGDFARPKSVILLWLEGGPSQLETFDPHPDWKLGGSVKRIKTSAAGIEIADTLPRLAERMHQAAILRSVVGKEGDHERAIYNIKTGYRPDPTLIHPAIGAILCHQSDLGADIPRHISILPGGKPSRGGYLGGKYDAFKVYDPAGPIPDVSRRVDQPRYDRRLSDLLDIAEKRFGRRRLVDLDRERTLHAATTQAAITMMTSEQLTAFDVTQEPEGVRESFGDSPFARGCLAAVRLIEVGVRCVEVTLGGWDSHINNHSLQTAGCQTLDPAAAALIAQLEARDLLDTTLVVIAGEFGRTPNINPAEGRDHWVHGFSMMLAGCGIRPGYVHGATASGDDFKPDSPGDGVQDPVSIADVHATLIAALGIDPTVQLQTPIGRPMFLSEGTPIGPLLAKG